MLVLAPLPVAKPALEKKLLFGNYTPNSDKSEKPFVKVNCATLPDTLTESQLFGYEYHWREMCVSCKMLLD